jgi:hypothetical protein
MTLNSIGSVDRVAPTCHDVTEYDRVHYLLYARLLDAQSEGNDWSVAASVILGCDVSTHPEAARLCYDSHVSRARWLIDAGVDLVLERHSG